MTAAASIISGLMMTPIFAEFFRHGPSGGVRTRGLMVPNHALCQLGLHPDVYLINQRRQTTFTALSAADLSAPGGFSPLYSVSVDFRKRWVLNPHGGVQHRYHPPGFCIAGCPAHWTCSSTNSALFRFDWGRKGTQLKCRTTC